MAYHIAHTYRPTPFVYTYIRFAIDIHVPTNRNIFPYIPFWVLYKGPASVEKKLYSLWPCI